MAKTHLIFPVLPTSKFHTALILENSYTRKGIGSSNPPSASSTYCMGGRTIRMSMILVAPGTLIVLMSRPDGRKMSISPMLLLK